jgi:hypothetical protein
VRFFRPVERLSSNMKSNSIRPLFTAILLAPFCLFGADASARLPRPIRASGVVIAVDVETQTFVFKETPAKKPVLLDWNKETVFDKDGRPVSVVELREGTPVVIYYKDLSFHNPLLKKVIWNGKSADKTPESAGRTKPM